MELLGRRSFALGAALAAACTKKDAPKVEAAPPLPPMPPPPSERPDAALPPRGEVGTKTLTFGDDARAVVVVPSWTKPEEKLPVLVALHGRGEAAKGPEGGSLGWVRDYALLRAIERLCRPPLTSLDYETFVEGKRLAEVNKDLEQRPFGGLVIVCPYLPDYDLGKLEPLGEYARYILETLLPRVRKEVPVASSEAAETGIDGVSLGGAAALRVGLANADKFGAVGTLQAAIRGGDQIGYYTQLAKGARAKNPKLALRLLTSKDDYFHDPIMQTSAAWRSAGITHETMDGPGPHDYPFNRGPGAIEMLLWHDRKLRPQS